MYNVYLPLLLTSSLNIQIIHNRGDDDGGVQPQ